MLSTLTCLGTPSSKVVIGDLDAVGGETVVKAIKKEGGYVSFLLPVSRQETKNEDEFVRNDANETTLTVITHSLRYREAAFIKCDVTRWDDQVALFELAITRFGSVDIVVGVGTFWWPSPSIVDIAAQEDISHRSQMQASSTANKFAGAT